MLNIEQSNTRIVSSPSFCGSMRFVETCERTKEEHILEGECDLQAWNFMDYGKAV